jgi:hypothetical protein
MLGGDVRLGQLPEHKLMSPREVCFAGPGRLAAAEQLSLRPRVLLGSNHGPQHHNPRSFLYGSTQQGCRYFILSTQ